MSEYTLYIATALLVTLSIVTSQLTFGPSAVDVTDSGVRIEQARNGADDPGLDYLKIADRPGRP